MTYKPTGQKIYFRGLDDPLKVTSITVDQGVLCWMWIEEAYEISSKDDFNMLDESIRGATPEGSDLFKQITVTFNPWNEHHWLKKRFFYFFYEETLDPWMIFLQRRPSGSGKPTAASATHWQGGTAWRRGSF